MTQTSTSYETVIDGGKHWSLTVRAGTLLRLTDREGGANVGMLFYNPLNPLERYNAPDTLKCQHTFKLTKGHCLYSDMGRIFCSIVEDSGGWHDTVCGNSTRRLVAERWGEKSYQLYRNEWTQNGHDAFLVEAGKYGLGRRDLVANVNWFSKVWAADDGALHFDPTHAAPGTYVDLRFEMDTLVLLHTCPHPLNGAAAYPRKPLGIRIGAAPPVADDDFCKNSRPENMRGFANNALYHLCGGGGVGDGRSAGAGVGDSGGHGAGGGSSGGGSSAVGVGAGDGGDGRDAGGVPGGAAIVRRRSALLPGEAVFSTVIRAGDYWIDTLRRGQRLRIVDVEGNQAADTLFFNAADVADRYSAVDTIREQANVYLSHGSKLRSTSGQVLAEIVADTVGRHDTLGGACASESNTVRYDLEKRTMHACRDSYLLALAEHDTLGLTKRDLSHNINFFMNVPVTPEGGLTFADGLSGPGEYVEMRAGMDVIVLISNCPQLNNPCNAYNPTPREVLMWDADVS